MNNNFDKIDKELRCQCGGKCNNSADGLIEHEKTFSHIKWMEHEIEDNFDRLKVILEDMVIKQNWYEAIPIPAHMKYTLEREIEELDTHSDMPIWKYIGYLSDFINSTKQNEKFNAYVKEKIKEDDSDE